MSNGWDTLEVPGETRQPGSQTSVGTDPVAEFQPVGAHAVDSPYVDRPGADADDRANDQSDHPDSFEPADTEDHEAGDPSDTGAQDEAPPPRRRKVGILAGIAVLGVGALTAAYVVVGPVLQAVFSTPTTTSARSDVLQDVPATPVQGPSRLATGTAAPGSDLDAQAAAAAAASAASSAVAGASAPVGSGASAPAVAAASAPAAKPDPRVASEVAAVLNNSTAAAATTPAAAAPAAPAPAPAAPSAVATAATAVPAGSKPAVAAAAPSVSAPVAATAATSTAQPAIGASVLATAAPAACPAHCTAADSGSSSSASAGAARAHRRAATATGRATTARSSAQRSTRVASAKASRKGDAKAGKSASGTESASAEGRSGRRGSEHVLGYTLLSINPRKGDFQQAWIRDGRGQLHILSKGDRLGSAEVLRIDGSRGEVTTAAGVIRTGH